MNTWLQVDRLMRSVDEAYGHHAKRFGLTVIEFQIMRALVAKDGKSATQVSKAVGRAPTSFTPNLDKLVEKGLIERRNNPLDRRAIEIYLTPEGARLRGEIAEAAAKAEGEARQIADEWRESAFDEAEGVALSGFVPERG